MKKKIIIIVILSICLNIPSVNSKSINHAEKPVPILAYHLVSDNINTKYDNLYVKPAEFVKQVRMLKSEGYTTIFACDIPNAGLYKKPVVITFDDGYMDNYQIVYPIIKKYKVKITIFVVSGFMGKKNFMSCENICEMSHSGLVSIQSHTVSHKYLPSLDNEQLADELQSSRKAIEDLVKIRPTCIAYPYGAIDCQQLAIVYKYYKMGFTTSSGLLSNEYNKHIIKRFEVGRNVDLNSIKHYLNSF